MAIDDEDDANAPATIYPAQPFFGTVGHVFIYFYEPF
jgi:hypothetical protein